MNKDQLSFLDELTEKAQTPRIRALREQQRELYIRTKNGTGPTQIKAGSIELPNGSIIQSEGLGLSGDEVRAIARSLPPPDESEGFIFYDEDHGFGLWAQYEGRQIPWSDTGELWR